MRTCVNAVSVGKHEFCFQTADFLRQISKWQEDSPFDTVLCRLLCASSAKLRSLQKDVNNAIQFGKS